MTDDVLTILMQGWSEWSSSLNHMGILSNVFDTNIIINITINQ